MSKVFFVLMVLAMAAVLGALIIGVAGMAKGGAFAKKYGNKLMRARVILQAAALGLFLLAVMTYQK